MEKTDDGELGAIVDLIEEDRFDEAMSMIDGIGEASQQDLYLVGQLAGLRWYCAYNLDDDIDAESVSEDLADETREDFLAGFAWQLLENDVLYIAEPAFERLTSVAPSMARSWHGYGAVLLEGEKWEQAIEALLRATQIDPEFPSSHYLLGDSYERAGLPVKAADAFEAYLTLEPNDEDALIRCGIAYSNSKKFQQSVVKFEQAIVINPESVSAFYNLAIVSRRTNDLERLNNVHEFLDREVPGDWRLPMVASSIQETHGQFDEAWASFEIAFGSAIESDDWESLDHIVESALVFACAHGFENRVGNWVGRIFQFNCVSNGVLFQLRKLTEPELKKASCFSIMIEGELSEQSSNAGANPDDAGEIVGYISTVRVSAQTEEQAHQLAMNFDRKFGRRPASTDLLKIEGTAENVRRGVYWCSTGIHMYPLDNE